MLYATMSSFKLTVYEKNRTNNNILRNVKEILKQSEL